MPTKPVNLRIDEELLHYLEDRANREHRTLSNMIISILWETKLLEEDNNFRERYGWISNKGEPSPRDLQIASDFSRGKRTSFTEEMQENHVECGQFVDIEVQNWYATEEAMLSDFKRFCRNWRY